MAGPRLWQDALVAYHPSILQPFSLDKAREIIRLRANSEMLSGEIRRLITISHCLYLKRDPLMDNGYASTCSHTHTHYSSSHRCPCG